MKDLPWLSTAIGSLVAYGAIHLASDIAETYRRICSIADHRANEKICAAIFHYEYYICNRDIRDAMLYACDITFNGNPIPSHFPHVSSGRTNGVS